MTFGAFDAGELSLDQVAPIAAKAPCWADAELCEFAKVATVTQLRRVMRSYDFAPDPVPEDDQRAVPDPPAEHLSLSHLDDGRWQLRGELDADHGASWCGIARSQTLFPTLRRKVSKVDRWWIATDHWTDHRGRAS